MSKWDFIPTRAEANNLLEWLVHLYHDVGKDGEPPTPAEWDEAWAQATEYVKRLKELHEMAAEVARIAEEEANDE